MESRLCAKCGKQVDARLIRCDGCDDFMSQAPTATDVVRMELSNQLRAELDERFKAFEKRTLKRLLGWVILGLTILGLVGGWGAIQVFEKVRDTVYARIAARFEDPNIKAALTEVAKERASEMLTKELRPSLDEARESTRKSLAEFDGSLETIRKRYDASIERLDRVTDLSLLIMAAQSDDRLAYDKLLALGGDKHYAQRQMAENVWSTVFEQHSSPLFQGGFSIPWPGEVEPNTLTFDQLRGTYSNAPISLRPALLEFVWNRSDLAKRDRMAFLIDVIQKDGSLRAVEYAGRYFNQGAGLKLKPMAVEEFVKWWKENQATVR